MNTIIPMELIPQKYHAYLNQDRLDFYSAVIDLAKSHTNWKDKKVADVGCQIGVMLYMLCFIGEVPKQIVGADKDYTAGKTFYALMKDTNINSSFYQIDIETDTPYLFSSDIFNYDITFCCQTLEHLKSSSIALRNLFLATKEKGTIILTVPDGTKDNFKGHINFWSPEGWREWVLRICLNSVVTTGYLNTKHGHLYAVIKKG